MTDPKQAKINLRKHSKDQLTFKNGKISLSRSLKQCERCNSLTNELNSIRRQIGDVQSELNKQRARNQEMNIICDEIRKLKNKLMMKASQIEEGPKKTNRFHERS